MIDEERSQTEYQVLFPYPSWDHTHTVHTHTLLPSNVRAHVRECAWTEWWGCARGAETRGCVVGGWAGGIKVAKDEATGKSYLGFRQ